MKNYIKCFVLIGCTLLTQSCDLSIEQIDARLSKIEEEQSELETEKVRLGRIKENKESEFKSMKERMDRFFEVLVEYHKDASKEKEKEMEEAMGDALYFMLKNGFKYDSYSKANFASWLRVRGSNLTLSKPVAYAIYQAACKGKVELNSVYENLQNFEPNENNRLTCITVSCLAAIKDKNKEVLGILIEKCKELNITEILDSLLTELG